MWVTSFRRLLVMLAVMLTFTIAPAAANAHTGTPLTSIPSYTGWGEMLHSYGNKPWTIYLYRNNGWVNSTIASGADVYIWPWGGNWRWGWTKSKGYFALWAPYAQV